MQDSNRITPLGVMKVNFKTNSPIAEQIKLPPHSEVTVSKKDFIYYKYCIAFPVKSSFKETKMKEKNI